MNSPVMFDSLRLDANASTSLDASKYVQGANQVDQANEQMARGQGEVAKATETTERKLTENTGALERLRRGIDEAYGRQQAFERGQNTLNRALDQGRISTFEHARFMELLRSRYQSTNEATDAAGGKTRNFGQIIGQAGFQIQDFAAQVAGGQSALVALGQQGSQLLGLFGVGGAIAGAVLTVGVLAAQMLGLGGSTKDAASAQDQLSEALKKANEFADTAEERTRRLRGERRLEAMSALEQAAAVQQLNLARAQEALDILERERRQRIEETRNQPGVDPNRILEDPIRRAREEAEAAARNLQDIQIALNRVSAAPDDPEARTRERVQREYRDRVDEDFEAAIQKQRDLEKATRDATNAITAQGVALAESVRTPEERAGASIGRAASLRAAGVISDETYGRAVAKANEELAKQSPLIREIERTSERAFDTVGGAITEMVVRGEGGFLRLRNVGVAMLAEIGQAALRLAVVSPFTKALSSLVGSAFSSFTGAASTQSMVDFAYSNPSTMSGGLDIGTLTQLGGFGGARASGGPVDPSSWYVVGEQGPEVFVPSTPGTIVPNGASGGTTVTINIAAGVTRQELFALLPVMEARVKQAVSDGRQRGGRFAAAMGT